MSGRQKTPRRHARKTPTNPPVRAARILAKSAAAATPPPKIALHESERFFRATLDALSAHIAILDEAGAIVAVNRAWRDFAVANQLAVQTAAAGANYLAVCDAATGPDAGIARAFAAGIREVLGRKRTKFSLEYPCHSPNERRWFIGHVTRFSGAGPVQLVVAHENITERAWAEEALRRSEEKFRCLFESSKDAVMILAPPAWTFTAGNPACVKMFGAKNEQEFIAHGPASLSPARQPDGRGSAEKARAMIETALRRGSHFFEWTHRRIGGEEFSADVLLTRVEQGKKRVVQATVRDITERKRAEAKLRESEAKFRALFEGSSYPMGLTKNGLQVMVNPAYVALFGYANAAEVIGQPLLHDIAPEERPRIRAFARRRRTREPVADYYESRGIRQDGTVFDAGVGVSTYELNGEVYSIGILHDITERKRTEESLRNSREQMRALATRLQSVREEERTSLAREMHDQLAQELTRLKIDLVWLERRVAKSAGAAAPATLAARVAEMSQVADSAIQSVQRIATGLRPAVLDSLGLCAAVDWQARDFQAHSEIACRVSVPAAEPPVSREIATATFRILQESLTNVARHAGATRVKISLRQEADKIILRIADNGGGIPPEALGSPLSIGLAGMRERTLLLGGSWAVRSRPGSGTTIEMRLPLASGGKDAEPAP